MADSTNSNSTGVVKSQELQRAARLNRALGAVVGLAVADALGSTVEFTTPEQIKARYGSNGHTEMRGGGSFNWEIGEYTDDGQMMMCLLESLVATNRDSQDGFSPKGLNIEDLGRRFVAWLDSDPKDIGITTSSALRRLKSGIPAHLSGDYRPDSQANGAIMRCSPLAVLWHHPQYRSELLRDSLLSAYPTHRSPIAAGAVPVMTTLIAEFINGSDYEAALTAALRIAEGDWHAILVKWDNEGRPHRGNSGWAVSTLLTALHCLHTTESFEAAVIKAVNGGNDADTVGAVTGALAGSFYGLDTIPDRWLKVLKDRQQMIELATILFEIGEK
ncbi:MAG TPA: ADP-ribosylglycohydrolase family protein [Chloroflexia bacterium]|nr:ADP-ribosylglycohydrolase family protein [Chloroflexia bacterium]